MIHMTSFFYEKIFFYMPLKVLFFLFESSVSTNLSSTKRVNALSEVVGGNMSRLIYFEALTVGHELFWVLKSLSN